VLTPEEVKSVRNYYKMTRSRFAELTGLGEATLARWEAGAVIQNRGNDRYLRLLSTDSTMEQLINLVEHPSVNPDESQEKQPFSARFPGFTPSRQMLDSRQTFQPTIQ